MTRSLLRGCCMVIVLSVSACTARETSAAEEKAIILQVLVPADTVLEFNGMRSKATGEARVFTSPPVPVGWNYNYKVKATWHGKTITRVVNVSHDAENRIDFREELNANTKTTPQASLKPVLPAPPVTQVVANPGVKAPEKPEPKVEAKPEPKVEAKPEPKAAGGEPLTLVLPTDLVLKPGEVRFVLVKVAPKSPGSLAAEPSIHFEGLPAGGFQCEPFTSSEFKAGEAFSKGYALRLAPTAAVGDKEVKVIVTVGALKANGSFKVMVSK